MYSISEYCDMYFTFGQHNGNTLKIIREFLTSCFCFCIFHEHYASLRNDSLDNFYIIIAKILFCKVCVVVYLVYYNVSYIYLKKIHNF